MSRKFQVKVIPSKWIEETGLRLDCGPYMSGAIEARELLQKHPLHPLCKLVVKTKGGIFNGPRFVRIFVDNPEHGIKLISGAEMIQSDLSNVNLIAKSQVKSMPYMVLQEGTTLVSSYGTIGRCCYVRSDMAGCIGSDNTLKIIPDQSQIKAGYLFSYLSSKYGVLQIIEGSGGSVVTFLDPSRVADIPVPRLGAVEEKAHELVQRAADLRVKAAALLRECGETLNQTIGFPDRMSLSYRSFSCTLANASQMVARMEATYYDAVSLKTDEMIATLPNKDLFSALDISIDETGRLKQIFVDEEYGVPFLTSGEIFQLSYAPTRFLSKRLLPMDEAWAMDEGDILLARSGQVGGIIGRGVWADRRFAGGCVSVDVLRIKTEKARIPAGYLYTYLCLTDVGYHQLIRTAAGSSIPHISASDVYKLWIPRCPDEIEKRIDESVRKAGILRADAQDYEDQARALVEQAIEEGGQ